MGKRDTKQIILDEALELFSVNGYEGVSVADIASAVNIKASSLYKHFKNKRDIFDKILEKAAGGYDNPYEIFGIADPDTENGFELYINGSFDIITRIATSVFRYFVHNGAARKLRRMLSIEQYGDPAAAKLLAGQYVDAPLLYLGSVFQSLMERGVMAAADADITAAHFYAPIYLMICLCDNSPDREGEALGFVIQHAVQFRRAFMRTGPAAAG